jgi:hypothetical protein
MKGQWGFIERSGKSAIQLRFTNVGNFSEGLAPAAVKETWGFIDRSGDFVIKPQFDFGGEFKEGLARVWTSNKSDLI